MQEVLAVSVMAVLMTKALLRAHHGPPRHPWERWFTVFAVALTCAALVVFAVDVRRLEDSVTSAAPSLRVDGHLTAESGEWS